MPTLGLAEREKLRFPAPRAHGEMAERFKQLAEECDINRPDGFRPTALGPSYAPAP